MLGVGQQIMHQQFFDERLQALGQLREENTKVLQHLRARQRFAEGFGFDPSTIDQVQLAAMAQQVVQVQVFLPQAFGMHLPDCRQRFSEHQLLLIGQRRQGFDCGPGIGQALRVFEEFEQ
ncbi:hypothetical protein D3C81_1610930 [compost metagenome]